MSRRVTTSSIGIDFSAAVAARSAGCSYALGEMSVSFSGGVAAAIARQYRAVRALHDLSDDDPNMICGWDEALVERLEAATGRAAARGRHAYVMVDAESI